uniref:Uncharacterized protein n=1 Tax=Panagrolaimus davidi TaxID=227884 RepID=A0A914PZ60_9BILA
MAFLKKLLAFCLWFLCLKLSSADYKGFNCSIFFYDTYTTTYYTCYYIFDKSDYFFKKSVAAEYGEALGSCDYDENTCVDSSYRGMKVARGASTIFNEMVTESSERAKKITSLVQTASNKITMGSEIKDCSVACMINDQIINCKKAQLCKAEIVNGGYQYGCKNNVTSCVQETKEFAKNHFVKQVWDYDEVLFNLTIAYKTNPDLFKTRV